MSDFTRLAPHDLSQFLRTYRLPGGRLGAVKVRHRAGREVTVEFRLVVKEAVKDLGATPKPVRLVLRLDGVDEFRFQMRPNQPKAKIADTRIAYLGGLFYVALDSLGLDPGEAPQVFDFRVAEVYAAGRELSWRVIEA